MRNLLRYTAGLLIASFVLIPALALAQTQPSAQNTDTPSSGWSLKQAIKDKVSDGFTSGIVWLIEITLVAIRGVFYYFMDYSGALFGWSVRNFGTLDGFNNIYSYVSQYIAQIWTFIRDLANIVIIGLFVFIAISIILGLKEYGQKKLIARVLIVAILINFSFLFTRIIINASNAFSTSIYKNLVTGVAGDDITAKYKKLLDINDRKTADASVDTMTKQDTTGRLQSVILNTLATIIFLLVSTGVFLYGSFLLLGRFIILIVALILSSLAFASYLLPNWSAAIWSRWWETLIKNALLGPIMMIFIWASMTMSEGLYNKLLAGKPLDAGKPEVVTGFIFIAGLLYMGMYIASSFSTQMAQRMALVGSALPLTLGSGAIGFAGRNTIGRSAAALAKMEAKRGKDLNLRAANLGDTPEAKRLQSLAASAGKRAEQLEKLSGRKFNPLDTGAGKALTKAFNITGGSTKNTQSFAEMIKSRENAANKTAAKVAPDKKVMEQAMKEAGQKAGEAVRKEMAGSIQDAKNAHAANTQGHTEERKVAVQERDAAQRRVKDEEAKFLQMQSNKSGNLAQQKRIIEAAQIEARHANEAAEQKLAQIDAKWTPTLQKSQDAIVKLQKEEGEKIKKAIEHSNHEFHESLESTERAVARKTGTFLQRAVDPITGDAKQIGDAVVKHTRKHHKEENMKSLLAQFANKDGNGEAH